MVLLLMNEIDINMSHTNTSSKRRQTLKTKKYCINILRGNVRNIMYLFFDYAFQTRKEEIRQLIDLLTENLSLDSR